jgi:Rrf2 family protein
MEIQLMANVLKVSEAASLALHSTLLLAAHEEESLSTKAMAEVLHVSENHLSKVLQRLAKAGLVQSARGPGGGFKLAKPATRLSLLDVYETVEGRLTTQECLLGKRVCRGNGCIFGGFLESVSRQIRDYLGKTKLSDVTYLIKEKGCHA